MFQQGIDGLLRHHSPETLGRIHRWIVVNEYDPQPKDNWKARIEQRYPFMECIQKSEEQKGQVKSLNILMTYLPLYTYWFHWEEGWVPTRPFLHEAFNTMDTTNITQLQLTNNPHTTFDWMTRITEPKTCRDAYCIVHPSKDLDSNLGEDKVRTRERIFRYWPLYSLQPSLNRVSFYTFGYFSNRTFPSPVVSEYDFGHRWYKHGGVKGVLKNGPLKRPHNYVSTHD